MGLLRREAQTFSNSIQDFHSIRDFFSIKTSNIKIVRGVDILELRKEFNLPLPGSAVSASTVLDDPEDDAAYLIEATESGDDILEAKQLEQPDAGFIPVVSPLLRKNVLRRRPTFRKLLSKSFVLFVDKAACEVFANVGMKWNCHRRTIDRRKLCFPSEHLFW